MIYLGALEAGGTKMVLSRLDENGGMLERTSMPTETPEITLPAMIEWFLAHPVTALGIGSFGPVDLRRDSPTYGYITRTPKLAWRDAPLLPVLRDALAIPVGLDTDVNAAAMAEAELGAAKGLDSCLYVTIGTGVGGGLVIDGKPVHGLTHPELGHQLLRPDPRDPMPQGSCPYHEGCLEGLAAGPSLQKRWGRPAWELPPDHVAWDIEAGYLAQMCHNAIMSFSPEKIILGGGVMQQDFLIPMVREKTVALLGGYLAHPAVEDGLKDLIVAPGLGIHSGVMGAWLLAKRAIGQ
ncbi:MAG: ROK family protein [Clostridia bacterium]|nr:ROK family protein [Clostridia bacterium]MBR4459390.1 ROK family protein [Clostridia bacterium]